MSEGQLTMEAQEEDDAYKLFFQKDDHQANFRNQMRQWKKLVDSHAKAAEKLEKAQSGNQKRKAVELDDSIELPALALAIVAQLTNATLVPSGSTDNVDQYPAQVFTQSVDGSDFEDLLQMSQIGIMKMGRQGVEEVRRW